MLENTEGVIKKDNPEATLGAQEDDTRKKIQHNICWTLPCASRNTLRKQDMRPTTKNWRQRRTEHRFFLFFEEIVTDMTM